MPWDQLSVWLSSFLPHLHRVWHYFRVLLLRQEEGMGIMKAISKSDRSIKGMAVFMSAKRKYLLRHWPAWLICYNCLWRNKWDINEANRQMFCSGMMIDRIPPMSTAIGFHILRTALQGGLVSRQFLHPHSLQSALTYYLNWEWRCMNGRVIPKWTCLPQAW